jgi:molybdate/tungstate transport system substrate-binding protein
MKRLLTYLILLIIISGCTGRNAGKEKVIVFHAGSLSVPLKKMEREYEILNPGVDIQLEGAGSVACARKITDLKRECDIMASADYKVIDKMLIPGYSDINIRFASNSMTIAYLDRSRRSDEINDGNWYEILMDEDVIYGRSDPNSDPCGYRTILTMKLAENYYGKEDIASVLLAKDINMIRPKEVDLVALLEVGALDYFFIYTSVAQQHNFNYIDLPPEVDLGESEMNDIYSTVSVDIRGSSPDKYITMTGGEMVYGITLLNDAPNRSEAIKFLRYFLGKEGRSIIEASGQDSLELPAGVMDKL